MGYVTLFLIFAALVLWAAMFGHWKAGQDDGPSLAFDCPICQTRPIQTARRLRLVRGYLLAVAHGTYEVVGCTECVSSEAKSEFIRTSLFGWWSPRGLLFTPFALLHNAANFTRRPNTQLLEEVLQDIFGVGIDELAEGEDGLSESNRRLLRTTAAALGSVAAVDGKTAAEWSEATRALVELSDHNIQPSQAEALLDQNRNRSIDASDLDAEQRLIVLHIAIQVAAADNEISAGERRELRRLATALGIERATLDALLRLLEGGDPAPQGGSRRAAAASVIGVDATASVSEVHTAWRKLALKHHPDRAAPDDREAANARMAEINDAYNYLTGASAR